MPKNIAIVGAGLTGRILALEALFAGFTVSLFDRDNKDGKQSCAFTGAGMLAPYAELESTEPVVAALGIESLVLWPQLLAKLAQPVFFKNNGSLVLAHPQDKAELSRFAKSIEHKLSLPFWQNSAVKPDKEILLACNRSTLESLEPQISKTFQEGIFLPKEGQIDNTQILHSFQLALEGKVDWHTNHEISSFNTLTNFEYIIDCRGLGAKSDLPNLRGVRGELLVLHAPEIDLLRPIRLMHPRHPIYIVPRQNNHFLVGATAIESEDKGPITVQSSLELLSAACTVHPSFAQATILQSKVNCRPALPDNLPSVNIDSYKNTKVVAINGLYRHGFLTSPKLAKLVMHYLISGEVDQNYAQIFKYADSNLVDTKNSVLSNGGYSFATNH